MADLEFKDCSAEFKLLGTETQPGELTGYAATWDGPDRSGETIIKGAFAKSLSEFCHYGFLADSHAWHKEIGTITSAVEDDSGLLVTAKFYSTPDAQIIRQKLKEKVERGARPGLSIGYQVLDSDFKDGVRMLKSLELFEVSVVSVPCNIYASVTGLKGVETKAWEEKENEIWYRVRDPGGFQEDSFRRIQLQKSPPIYAVIGRLKGETTTTVQALRFPKDSWSMAEAKKWVAEHRDSLKSFVELEHRRETLRRLYLQFLARLHAPRA